MNSAHKRHIFIAGLHRSGTSLLHRILRSHPDISGFHDTQVPEDEGQHLQTIFPPGRDYGGAGKFCFAQAARMNEHSPLLTAENRDRLMRQWGAYWDLQKPLLIEKSPPNLIRMRFLQAMFPGSAFIIVVRHPLAVAHATLKWSKTSIRELVEHWVVAHQIMLEDLPAIGKWHLIRYEDMIADPQATLSQIYQWLDIKEAVRRETVETGSNDAYFRLWENEARQNPMLARRVGLLDALPAHFGYYFTPPYIRHDRMLS